MELLPQRRPFILIDRMRDFTMERSVTEFEVPADGVLVRDGCLSEAGIMENIAQSCAARIGYINKYINHNSIKLGIIGAVRDLKIEFLPAAGSLLETAVDVVSEVFNITLVTAEVKAGERLVACCQMKISLTDIDKED